MAEKKNPTIKKAREEVTYLTGDEAVKRLEFLREKWEMDRISDINHAKEEGKQEEKIETARKLIKKRMDIELIIEITGLSRDEIEDLKKEKNI